MKHRVIALGRQFGSGGREIAKKLATEINIPCYDKELISLAAQRGAIQEDVFTGREERRVNPWLYPGIYDGSRTDIRGLPPEDILFQLQSEVIRETALEKDCIIVGRCADAVLEAVEAEVLSVFICAPFNWRVLHRMELEHLDEKETVTLVRRMDKQRKRYYDYYTDRSWGKPDNYDLCINSAQVGIEQSVKLIGNYWRKDFF